MHRIIIILFIIISLIRGEDYYKILGVNRSADQNEIRRAFKKLAILYHPDKNNDDPNAHDKFIRLKTAYEVLKNSDLRRKYDLYGENGLDNFNEKHTHHSWDYYQHNFDIHEDEKYVITLEKNDYFENVIDSESSWFVNFYSPKCSYCHYFAPIWAHIAKLLDGVANIATVNCEYNRQLCTQLNIYALPILLYYNKNSQHNILYKGEKTQEAIVRFVLDRLDIYVPEINNAQWSTFLQGKKVERPMLIFICSDQRNCFTSDDRLIVAATFDKMIDVKVFMYENSISHEKIPYDIQAVYLPTYDASFWKPVFFNDLSDTSELIERLIDQLPSPQELTENGFMIIKKTEFDVAWLIYFYFDNSMGIDLQMKKLYIGVKLYIKLGKINCSRNDHLCHKLGINRYPMWGILKPGGAFELNHGKNSNIDIINFAKLGAKTTNILALNEEEALSILQRNNGHEAWFLDWYSPWCPPCINFLTELRKVSLKFDASIVRFGTIDCTVHVTLCRQYNIQYYPTAMLINDSSIHQFYLPKTAVNVVHFINEKRNPSVVELTSENFHRKLAKKKSKAMWIVDYFSPWCAPCQKLFPIWTTVAKALNNLSFVNVANVNCVIEASLCESQGIRIYPNIRLYPLDSEGLRTVALYTGHYNFLSILTWITSFFPKKIHDLTPFDYQEALNSKRIWIIDFYLPQCWQCQKIEPEFAIVSQLLKKVKFGRINCNLYMNECAHINSFPMLMLYDSTQKRKNNGIRIEATTADGIRDEILRIIKSHLKHDEL